MRAELTPTQKPSKQVDNCAKINKLNFKYNPFHTVKSWSKLKLVYFLLMMKQEIWFDICKRIIWSFS